MPSPATPSPRLVVATDFSDPARVAFRHALTLAKMLNASIEIVHVQTPLALLPDGGVAPSDETQEAYEDRIDALLTERYEESLQFGVACVTTSLRGDARTQILNHADRTGAFLIVAGTHGRTGLAHAVLGSVAEALVRHSTIPVVVVPRRAGAGRGA